jgi:tetratricopeptide (TPR) repeat protein
VQYTAIGEHFDGASFTAATMEYWSRTIGHDTFLGLHHWCASIHFYSRARLESDPRERDFMLRRARDDALFSFTRAEPQSPVYPDMAITTAQIFQALGKPEDAYAALQKSIEAQPTRPEPYVLLAILHRGARKLDQAREVLLQGDHVTRGTSAEIQYNLGLINLEIGDTAAANANARNAYRLGYPLPGLKDKLRRLGKWSDADEMATSTNRALHDGIAPSR